MTTRLAIMQPYLFPYIGYWQLMHAADRFVVYDDVNYRKGGWINRNRILVNGQPTMFTAPLQGLSAYKRICDISLQSGPVWREKLIKAVGLAYGRAPCFSEVSPVVFRSIRHQADNLSEYLLHQLRTMADFMGIQTEIISTSRKYSNHELSGQERVLDICKKECAQKYINLPGGQSLYNRTIFNDNGIDLRFIVPNVESYAQRAPGFSPNLSIIDALMELGVSGVRRQLDNFRLSTNELASPQHENADG
ncbi:MAG: WbqC family protein [Betaproteobacteria bacterium]|nr:WbqC family protein [Betaproteobacteria bacterium]